MKASKKPTHSNALENFIESGEFDRALNQILEDMAGGK